MKALKRTDGFSLIEIVIALVLIAVLTAFVYPVIVQQIGKWQSVRVARDLVSLRSSMEQFHLDTGNYPRQFTHFANPIAVSDRPVESRTAPTLTYSSREVDGWNGPYVDRSLAASLTDAQGLSTGFEGTVATGVLCLNPDNRQVAQCGRGTWVAIFISGLRSYQFKLVNQLIDPAEEALDITEARAEGRLVTGGPIGIDGDLTPVWVYYLAVPYVPR